VYNWIAFHCRGQEENATRQQVESGYSVPYTFREFVAAVDTATISLVDVSCRFETQKLTEARAIQSLATVLPHNREPHAPATVPLTNHVIDSEAQKVQRRLGSLSNQKLQFRSNY
jgi:hypothetical protein